MPSSALDQASLVLGGSQEVCDLLHIVVGHAFERRHLSVRERAEEMGDAQSELHAREVKAEANYKYVRNFLAEPGQEHT